MKKIVTWMLCLALLLGAAGAYGETSESFFSRFEGMEWSFSSGVGGWSAEMRIQPDGTFSGEYHDSEMGETAETYPDGTLYLCSFTGQMHMVEQVDENTWKIAVDSLQTDGQPGEESIEDGIRYVISEPYGISAGDTMLLLAPGTPVSSLTEDMLFWSHVNEAEQTPDTLENYFLYSEKNASGFVSWLPAESVAMPNPWVELTAAELMDESGLTFAVPEGAEQVIYRYLKDEGLAEMLFTIGADEFCCRVQQAELADGELLNNSGMYFAWENEEDVEIRGCRGTIGQARTGSVDWVELCLWYDAASQRMYSLDVSTTDPDGLDLTAIADQCMP